MICFGYFIMFCRYVFMVMVESVMDVVKFIVMDIYLDR